MSPDDANIEDAGEMVLRRRAKAALRQRARGLRNTIPKSAIRARSQQIVETLLALPAIESSTSVALFYPIESRNEVDLRPLDEALRARAKALYYPAIDEQTRVMTFRKAGLHDLDEHGFGFREPSRTAPEPEALDVIVVPALQIDPRGHRIGYGAGYYDRTLPRFAPPAISIGVAFHFQLIPEVPITDGDVALDIVVTDEATILVAEELRARSQ